MAEAELRSGEFGHHGLDCADLQPVSWPGANQRSMLHWPMFLGSFFLGQDWWRFFAQNSGSIFSETQVGWSFDDPVLEQQAHRRLFMADVKENRAIWMGHIQDTNGIWMGKKWIYIEPKIPTIGSWYISEKGGKTGNIRPFKWGTSWWQSIGLVGTLSSDNPPLQSQQFNSKTFQ